MNRIYGLIIVILINGMAFGQGCSDAGFCTMGAMKPDQPFNKRVPLKLRSVEVSFYRGTTTTSPVVYVGTIDMSFNIIDNKTFFQIKLPYQAVTGNFGNTGGLSDISYCLTRNIYSSEEYNIGVTLGGKIPTNNSNLKDDRFDNPLPMYYQTSLGTYDAIAGISLVSRKWLFATGIQHPFNQNGNQFTYDDWIPVYEGGPDYVRTYAPSYELKRGTDIMFRVERNFRYSRINFSVGLLPIWRITKDEIFDVNLNERVKLDGTLGMALSGIITAGYNFNVKSGIRLLLGHKITQRDVNPDGLTREMVSTLSYTYRF
ncbi:MAG: hypothetical protein MUC73_02840 [Cyclobacteriaceae bacterium]|jgi:hypothetical protein|nr:hypothetical protein [Cyclobacteriaceae bacterium]